MKRYFRYSKEVWLLTLLTLLVLLVVSLALAMSKAASVVWLVCLAVCWVPVLAASAFAPVYYEETRDEVVLGLLCGRRHFRREEFAIGHCVLTDTGMVRLFGSGGFLGFYGWYCHRDIGRFLLFSTGKGTRFLKLTHKVTGRVVLIQE